MFKQLSILTILAISFSFWSNDTIASNWENSSYVTVLEDGSLKFSNIIADTCLHEATDGGQICCDSEGCGPQYDPGVIYETQAASGGSGNYVYMWLISELMYDRAGNPVWSTPEPIFNADGSLYDGRELIPGPLDVSTRYRRCVSTRECQEAGFNFFVETDIVIIKVLDCDCRPKDGGEIDEDQSVCEESFDPDTLRNIRGAMPFNLGDPIRYQWYYAYSDIAFDVNTWQIITGANDTSYDPPVTDRDIYYIRMAFNPNCRRSFRLSNKLKMNVGGDIRVFPYATHPRCHDSNDGKIRLDVQAPYLPIDIEWSNDRYTDTICDLSPGIYSYTVTDDEGCTREGEVVLIAPDSLFIKADVKMNQCEGVSDGAIDITACGGTAPYTYEWDNGLMPIEDQDSLLNGIYCVTVTDANDCTAEDCFMITSIDTILLCAEIDSVTCYGDMDGAIDVTVKGGTAPYIYEWDNGVTIEDLDSLPGGIYCLTVTDANGCMADSCWVVYEPDSLVVTGIVKDETCFGDCDGMITVIVSGGTPPYIYNWEDIGLGDRLRDSLCPGIYCVTVTDAHGCMDDECFEVMEGVIVIDDIVDTIYKCPGDIIFLNPNGSSDFEYQWSPEDLVSDPKGVNPTTCPDQDTCIFVIITDPESGCFIEHKIVIIVKEFPDVDFPDQIIACNSKLEICLDDYPGFEIDWSCTEDFIDILPGDTCICVNIEDKDIIFFRLTDSMGCDHIDSIRIINQTFTCDLIDSIAFCQGDTFELCLDDFCDNMPTWDYSCLDDFIIDVEGSCLYLYSDIDTSFSCEIGMSNGFCSYVDSIHITIFENNHFVIATSDPEKVNKGQKAQLNAESPNDDDTFIWTPDQFFEGPNDIRNPIVFPKESIVYTVFSQDSLGCNAFDTLSIEYTCICDEPFIYVPNAFTPNDDNLNDTYNVVAPEDLVEEMYLAIYNRWGEMVFETIELSVKWDGTFHGELVNTDVYGFYLRIKCYGNDEEFIRNGNVSVLY